MTDIIVRLAVFFFLYSSESVATFLNTTKKRKSSFILDPGYDKYIPPFDPKTGKVNVNFQLDIISVADISTVEQTWTVILLFGMEWVDHRIHVTDNNGEKLRFSKSVEKLKKKIWVPSIDSENVDEFSAINDATGHPTLYGNLQKGGIVQLGSLVRAVVVCAMQFTSFPFDKHECFFTLSPTLNHTHLITCSSDFNHIPHEEVWKNMDFSYSLRKLTLMEESSSCHVPFTSYTKECCGFKLKFKRSPIRHLLSQYLPGILFTCVSWCSFVVDPILVPGRCGLLTSLMMVFHTMIKETVVGGDVLPSSSFNRRDVFLFFSFSMVCSAILEYAVVLFYMRYADYRATDLAVIESRISVTTNYLKNKLSFEPAQVMEEEMDSSNELNSSHEHSENTVELLKDLMFKREMFKDLNEQEGGLNESTHTYLDRVALKIFPTVYLIFLLGHFLSGFLEYSRD